MLITDWFCIAVAGATIDGRTLEESWLEEVAAAYSQETYNARIWPEHIRGVTPEGLFKALGDVVQLKSERIKGGDLAGKLGLYAKISPHAELVAMVRNGQKVHFSVELQLDFADTGKAYLVGLGVTDSPASLGTGIMKFSTAERSTHVFSQPLQADIKEPAPTSTADYALQFAQLQGQNTTLIQQFSTLQTHFAKMLDDLGELKKVQQETLTIVEEIGNQSAGRFQRKPATGQGNYSQNQPVDY